MNHEKTQEGRLTLWRMKVRAVQETYQHHKRPETTDVGIWREHIRYTYFISYSTFRHYLTIRIRRSAEYGMRNTE